MVEDFKPINEVDYKILTFSELFDEHNYNKWSRI